MTRPTLNFDNGNNGAISLHILAEYCRRGDVKIISTQDVPPQGMTVTLHFNETVKHKP